MDKLEILSRIDTLLKSLRSCGTQAEAVAWMRSAYEVMENVETLLDAGSESPETYAVVLAATAPPVFVLNERDTPYVAPKATLKKIRVPASWQNPSHGAVKGAFTRSSTRKLENILALGKESRQAKRKR